MFSPRKLRCIKMPSTAAAAMKAGSKGAFWATALLTWIQGTKAKRVELAYDKAFLFASTNSLTPVQNIHRSN
jgi:hypothetical protein